MTAIVPTLPTPGTTAAGRAMGCRVHVTVSAPSGGEAEFVAEAFRRLDHLERCWSRFLPNSDISRLNRAGGRPISVDPSTVVLIAEMAAGVRATAGSFDPTLIGSVVGLGMVTTWGTGGDTAASATDRLAWIDDTIVDPEGPRIRIPDGVHLDPGAIGKGLAADLVATELVAAGATGARIVVGGDARVVMPSAIDVHDPTWSRTIDRIVIADGGIATSGIGPPPPPGGRRRLGTPVVDPSCRRPLDRPTGTGIVQVTVAASTAVAAEVLATSILVDKCDRRLDLDRSGVGVMAVHADGRCTANSSWAKLRPTGNERQRER